MCDNSRHDDTEVLLGVHWCLFSPAVLLLLLLLPTASAWRHEL
jgi:hypothetical protein